MQQAPSLQRPAATSVQFHFVPNVSRCGLDIRPTGGALIPQIPSSQFWLAGGEVVGTLIGAFFIAVIKSGMNLIDVDPFNQLIVPGAVLLGAALIDTLKRKATRG